MHVEQLPLRLHSSQETRLGDEPPRFVIDHVTLSRSRVGQYAASIHADAQLMTSPMSWFEPEIRDRSSDTMGRCGSNRTVDGRRRDPPDPRARDGIGHVRHPGHLPAAGSPRTRAWPQWAQTERRPRSANWVSDPATATSSAASRAVCSVDRSGRPSADSVSEPNSPAGASLSRLATFRHRSPLREDLHQGGSTG